MRTKFYRIILAIIALSVILSACAPAATPTPIPPTAAPVKAADTPVPAAVPPTAVPPTAVPPTAVPPTATAVPPTDVPKPVDLELWAGGRVSEAAPPPDDWVAYSIIREKLNINLKLVLEPSSFSDQDTKINAAGAANALPDVFMVNRDVWYKLVNAGLVAKVDDLLPLMPVRTKTHYSDEARNKLVTLDGAMYGLPDPGQIPFTDALVIRKDWLDKLGLQAPKTLDEFLAVAKAFTEKDPDGNGKNDTYGFGAFIDSSGLVQGGLGPRFDFIFGAYGVSGVWNVSSTDSFGLNVRNPNYMKGLQFVKSLVDAKVIDPDWPTLKKDEFRARWKQGKYGIMLENFAALSTKSNYADFDKNFPSGEWVVLPPPTGPDGLSSEGIVLKTARIYAVSQRAIDAGKGPAIAKLLEWMANDEGYYLLGFGVKDVNYKVDDKGYITTKDIDPKLAWTAKETQPLTQLANMVYIFSDVELVARYPSFKTASGRLQEPLAYLAGFSKQTWTDSTGASIINPPSNAADFTRFYSENIVKFALGQQKLDEASWKKYLDGLDGLGAKDLEAAAKESLVKAGFLK
jgi:putative aldouronate transport system substrate-binding protein